MKTILVLHPKQDKEPLPDVAPNNVFTALQEFAKPSPEQSKENSTIFS